MTEYRIYAVCLGALFIISRIHPMLGYVEWVLCSVGLVYADEA